MQFADRFIQPLGQTSGTGPNVNAAFASGSFTQCPVALLQGMSEEQMCDLAAFYQKAYEQALRSLQQKRAAQQRRRQLSCDALRGINWN